MKFLDKNDYICDAKKILQIENKNYFYYSGEFYFDESPNFKIDEKCYVDGIAILSSNMNTDESESDGYSLKLLCSAINFSDTRKNGKYQLNSGNYYFFKGYGKMNLETVFIKVGIDNKTKTIYGSPLFLALDDGGVLL